MLIKKFDVEEIQNSHYSKTKWMAMLDEFVKSDMTEAEIVDDLGEYHDCQSMAGSLKLSIKRFGYPVKAFTRKNRVFIAKPSSPVYPG